MIIIVVGYYLYKNGILLWIFNCVTKNEIQDADHNIVNNNGAHLQNNQAVNNREVIQLRNEQNNQLQDDRIVAPDNANTLDIGQRIGFLVNLEKFVLGLFVSLFPMWTFRQNIDHR